MLKLVKTMKRPSDLRPEDTSLVHLVQGGDSAAFSRLFQRYLPLLSRKANHYAKQCGLDAEDFLQEGLMALYRAAVSFDEDAGASFKTYASTCMENAMVDAVRRFVKSSGKGSLSLDQMEEGALHEKALRDPDIPLEDAYAVRERLQAMVHRVETVLSDFERQVLALRLRGYSYGQASEKLGVSPKSVDNAMQRIKRKLRQADGSQDPF